MNRVTVAIRFLAALASFLLCSAASAEDLAASLVGAWKCKSIVFRDAASGDLSFPFGLHPTCHIVYTKGGLVVWSMMADGRKPPAGGTPTDTERVTLFNSMSAGSGTYRVEGDTFVVDYLSSSNQTWTGQTHRRKLELTGNTLVVTAPPAKNNFTGREVEFLVTYERLE